MTPRLPEPGRTLRFVVDAELLERIDGANGRPRSGRDKRHPARAVPAGSKTEGTTKDGRRYTRDSSGNRGKAWRADVIDAAAFACMDNGWPLTPAPFAYPAAVHVTMMFEQTRAARPAAGLELWPVKPPDVLKTARAIEDALTGRVWTDDAQIVGEYLGKCYGAADRVVVVVTELLEVPE